MPRFTNFKSRSGWGYVPRYLRANGSRTPATSTKSAARSCLALRSCTRRQSSQTMVQMDKLRVNSRHHQANRTVQKPLQISGKASDMIIEAVESMAHTFVLGVQWHPENMFVSGDKVSQRIFQGFINACRTTKAKGVGLN